MRKQGYQQEKSDHTMLFRHTGNGRKTIWIVYVDDIIITGDETEEIERLQQTLATYFEVKYLGQM